MPKKFRDLRKITIKDRMTIIIELLTVLFFTNFFDTMNQFVLIYFPGNDKN